MEGPLDKLGWIAEMSVFLQFNGLSKCIIPLPVQARKRLKVLKVTVILACSDYTNLESALDEVLQLDFPAVP